MSDPLFLASNPARLLVLREGHPHRMVAERAEDLFLGGVVDEDDAALLYRGNLDRLVVPLEWFEPRPKARPDFGAFAVTEFG